MSTGGEIWLSAGELSLLGERFVAGLPSTMRGCTRKAQREGWVFREVKGGGGPGGMRTEYQPPTDVLALIQSFLVENPEFFKLKRSKVAGTPKASASPASANKAPALSMYRVQEPGDSHGEIDEYVLSGCLDACSAVHGEEFTKLGVTQQIGYAVDLYNLLVRMCHSQGVAIGDMRKMETKGLVEQLGAFVRLGWARKFPPPPMQVSCFF